MTFTVPIILLNRIDAVRGGLSRAECARQLLELALDGPPAQVAPAKPIK